MSWDICQDPNFTAEDQRLLRETTVTADGPGTVLRDFERLLAYVGEHPLPLTSKGILGYKIVPVLNDLLSRPVAHGMKRPSPRSLPPVNGLYLLLRASGLTTVASRDKQLTLRPFEPTYAVWQGLNPTERYGALLEAWLIRGKEAIVDPSRAAGSPAFRDFSGIADFFYLLPDAAQAAAGAKVEEVNFTEEYHAALLELFGCIEVELAPPRPGEGWPVASMVSTPFGRALVTLLYTQFFRSPERPRELIWEENPRFGYLQPVLAPYFPEWQQTLTLPEEAPFRPGVHIFDVRLERARRRIAIPAEGTLADLAAIILDAVEFGERDHLYEFIYRDRYGAKLSAVHPRLRSEEPPADEVAIGDLPLNVGETFSFIFDFGASWKFAITLVEVDESMALEKPEVVDSKGDAPPQYPQRGEGW